MNKEKIFDLIDGLFAREIMNDDDLQLLAELSKNEEAIIRVEAAKLLARSNYESSRDILIHLCGDSDELVRVNACDSLCVFPNEKTYEALKKCLREDESPLVKAYALLSVIDIMRDISVDEQILKDLFLTAMEKETAIGIKSACAKGLYLLGGKEYLVHMLNGLSQEEYTDRCAAVHALVSILNEENFETIKSALLELYAKEKTEAVQFTIENALEQMDEFIRSDSSLRSE